MGWCGQCECSYDVQDNSARGTAPEATALPMSGKVGLAHLAGVWIKDREASDLESYERALDLMRLGSIQKVRRVPEAPCVRPQRCTRLSNSYRPDLVWAKGSRNSTRRDGVI